MANGESVYGKLKVAHRAGRVTGAKTMDHTLTAFAAECSLRRLGKADMLSGIVLKGGRLWSVWDVDTSRPTQDFDYSAREANLRRCSDDIGRGYAERVLEAIATDADDGLVVDPSRFKMTTARNALGGCAIEGTATLHTAQIPLIVEVGFGHELPDGATEELVLKPLVSGIGSDLMIHAYKPEMWLAEKVRIAFEFGDGNSRLKDFFDMHFLFDMPLDRALLKTCFEATCRDFGVDVPSAIADVSGFSPEFVERNAKLWRDRRWPEWSGRKFDPGQDPELGAVVAGIAANVEAFGMLTPEVAFAP